MQEATGGIQLKMNFDAPSGNRFRQCLENGIFTVLFEHAAPGMELADCEAAEKLRRLEKTALEITELPCALALTDRYGSDKSRRAVDYAALLPEKSRNSHLVYLSGRNTDADGMRGMLAAAHSLNLANLVLVSGAVWGENHHELRKKSFTESTAALQMLREFTDNELFFAGAGVNAHYYSAPALYSSIAKLVKKFNRGAEFAVTQAGFDMAQLDALRTYLTRRGIHNPLIARLMLLTPDKVDKITLGKLLGINMTDDFRAILNKELRFSESQFEAAQYRRLELQAVGCKLAGFSGIQIAGADTPEKMQIAIKRIHRAFKEFTSFGQWVEEYKFYMARSDMAPSDQQFYLFEKLLENHSEEAALPQMAAYTLPAQNCWERFSSSARRFLFPEADKQPSRERVYWKKLLAGCRGCGECRLPQTQFYCPRLCPKQMCEGPCGELRDDGACIAGGGSCVHLNIWQEAQRRGEAYLLEGTAE